MLTPHAVDELWLDALVQGFEQLQPDDIARMGDWYAPNARFKDPFKDVGAEFHIFTLVVFLSKFDQLCTWSSSRVE